MDHHPEVWLLLGQALNEHFFFVHPDFWSGLREFTETLTPSQRAELTSYIASLLADQSLSDTDLAEAWKESGAQHWVADDQIREWLGYIRHFLETGEPAVPSR